MGELIVILIVALLFLGPEKLPDAAKTISKGIRDFRKQTRELQQSLEDDEEIGGAIRDLKSALRGDEIPPYKPPVKARDPAAQVAAKQGPAELGTGEGEAQATEADAANAEAQAAEADANAEAQAAEADANAETQSAQAQEADPLPLIRPPSGSVTRSASIAPEPSPEAPESSEKAHG